MVARHVVGKNLRIDQRIHDGITSQHKVSLIRLDFRVRNSHGLDFSTFDHALFNFVHGVGTQEVQTVLVGMHGEKVALVAIGQLLKCHGSRIDQRVEQIQSCFVHEPREFIHEALVSNGWQVDQGRALLGFEISSARVKIHMRKDIICPKGHFVQIASLQFKRRFLGIDGALFHEEIARRKFCLFKIKCALASHSGGIQFQLPIEIHFLLEEFQSAARP